MIQVFSAFVYNTLYGANVLVENILYLYLYIFLGKVLVFFNNFSK